MRNLITRRSWQLAPLAMLPLLVLLGGCVSSMGPISWDSGYRQFEVPASDDEAALRQAIVPNTCRAQPGESGVVALPPGCANDLNLHAMVVDPRDLLHGSGMGPAQAGPVAAAARERLEDRDRANSRRIQLESEARGPAGRSITTGQP